MTRNPHPHPVVLTVLLAGFVALAGVVWYFISPVPAFHRELRTTATAAEPYRVTTTGRYRDPLPPEKHYWRRHFEFTGVNGERGYVVQDFPPGADEPAAGETAPVRYTPCPELAAPHQPPTTPGRFADGVTLWGEGKWHLAGWVGMTLFAAVAGVVYVRRWRAIETIRTAHARGELTQAEAAEQMVNSLM